MGFQPTEHGQSAGGPSGPGSVPLPERVAGHGVLAGCTVSS